MPRIDPPMVRPKNKGEIIIGGENDGPPVLLPVGDDGQILVVTDGSPAWSDEMSGLSGRVSESINEDGTIKPEAISLLTGNGIDGGTPELSFDSLGFSSDGPAVEVKLRRGTSVQWAAENPLLASGEQGYETDTGRLKVGTGIDVWSDLDYYDERVAEVVIADPYVVDALISSPAMVTAAAAAIDAEPRVAQLVTDVAAVDTRVDTVVADAARGDKTTTLKSAFYEPAADGVTDDRAALQALLDDGAGGTVTIAKGNYAIVGALVVPDSTEVVIQPGTVIEQKTKYTPVFDLFFVNDVVIRGNGALLTWTGSRAYTYAGGAFRGNDPYVYGAGVYVAGSRNKIHDLRSHGFTCGVNLTGFNGTVLANYHDFDNEVHNLTVENVDFGVLFGGQVNPVLRNIRGSYNMQTGSSNPPHLLYVTGSGKNRNIDIDGVRARDGVGGHAFQFKGVDGGKAKNLHAHNCEGLLSLNTSNDLDIEASASDDLGHGELGTVYIFGVVNRCKVDVHDAAAIGTTGYRLASIDTTVSDTTLEIKGRIVQPTDNETFSIFLRGTRNTVIADLLNLDGSSNVRTTGRNGVQVTGTDHRVVIEGARGVGRVVSVEAGATNCSVDINSAAIQTRSSLTDQVLNIQEPSTTLTRNGSMSATITGPGQQVRADATRHRTVHVEVNTADAFTMYIPYGGTPRGTRITYIISNKSGGTMGAVTWFQHTLNGTWSSPTSAQEKSIEFIWDGVRWKEIAKTV